jgi:hypothetical protein
MSIASSENLLWSVLYYLAEQLNSAGYGDTSLCLYASVDNNKDYDLSDYLPFIALDLGIQKTDFYEMGAIYNTRERMIGLWLGTASFKKRIKIESVIDSALDTTRIKMYDVTTHGKKYVYAGDTPIFKASTLVGSPNPSFVEDDAFVGYLDIMGSVDIARVILEDDSVSDFHDYIRFPVVLPIA